MQGIFKYIYLIIYQNEKLLQKPQYQYQSN